MNAEGSSHFSQQIINSVREGIIVYGPDLKYQLWNPFMEHLTGMPADEVLGCHPLVLFPFLAEVGVISDIERVLAGETVSEIEFLYRIPQTGRFAWVAHATTALLDAHGQSVGVLSTVRDITDRKRAELMTEERMRFEQLIADLSASLAGSSADQVDEAIDQCLRALADFLAVDRMNVVEFAPDRTYGTRTHSYAVAGIEPSPIELFHVKQAPWYLAQVLEGKTVFLPLLPDGLPEYAVEERQLCSTLGIRSLVAVPLRIGTEVIGLINFQFVKRLCDWRPDVVPRLRLIGEVFASALARKHSERILRESESRFRTLFEDAPVAIGIGREGVNLHANRAFLKMFRIERLDEIIGRPIADLWAPEWRAIINERARQRSRGLPVIRGYEAVAQRKDGSQFPAYISVATVELPDGRATLAFIANLTERKEAEEKLQEMHLQLTHVARLSTLGEMAAELAHELNHPLYAILNYAKAARNVLSEEGSPNLEDLRAWTEEIADTAVSAAEVVKRLRSFARRGESPRIVCRIDELVHEASGLMAIELRASQVSVDVACPTASPPVEVDRVQIQQVLVNLLSNAKDAVETLPMDRRQVEISVELCGADVKVAVSDHGPGLPPGNDTRIFEPFVTTKAAGVGMGLSIARTIVEAHGGRLWAQPNPEGGAVFFFTLPLSDGGQSDDI
jgi:two-component system sensor kinase FixL